MKNSITMTGDIDWCRLFVHRVPAEQLQPLLPPPLQLVTQGAYGFVNVVVSELSHMRPNGLPAWLGMSYRHVAYRLHCRFGQTEGLYFLRSDADNRLITAAGNLLTDFKFHFADILVSETEVSIQAKGGNGKAMFDLANPPALASGSPFATLQKAEKDLKYGPAAFFVNPGRVDVLRITRDEAKWRSKLISVERSEFEFLSPFDATLEVCYHLEPIRYIWNRAERVPI